MVFFFSSRRRHTRLQGDWSSDVCSSDLRAKIASVVLAHGQFLRVPPETPSVRSIRTTSPLSPPDRKSTRLNSSHLVISYAVFCLKKKKNIKDDHPLSRSPRHLRVAFIQL